MNRGSSSVRDRGSFSIYEDHWEVVFGLNTVRCTNLHYLDVSFNLPVECLFKSLFSFIGPLWGKSKLVTGGFPTQRVSNAENVSISLRHHTSSLPLQAPLTVSLVSCKCCSVLLHTCVRTRMPRTRSVAQWTTCWTCWTVWVMFRLQPGRGKTTWSTGVTGVQGSCTALPKLGCTGRTSATYRHVCVVANWPGKEGCWRKVLASVMAWPEVATCSCCSTDWPQMRSTCIEPCASPSSCLRRSSRRGRAPLTLRTVFMRAGRGHSAFWRTCYNPVKQSFLCSTSFPITIKDSGRSCSDPVVFVHVRRPHHVAGFWRSVRACTGSLHSWHRLHGRFSLSNFLP